MELLRDIFKALWSVIKVFLVFWLVAFTVIAAVAVGIIIYAPRG